MALVTVAVASVLDIRKGLWKQLRINLSEFRILAASHDTVNSKIYSVDAWPFGRGKKQVFPGWASPRVRISFQDTEQHCCVRQTNSPEDLPIIPTHH